MSTRLWSTAGASGWCAFTTQTDTSWKWGTQVVKRFAAQGMTEAQVARRMDVSLDYVRECMEG